jgi:acyl carrier protein
MADEIEDILEKYLAREILKEPDRKIPADEALISSGLIDSFSLVDMALFVEDAFGVRIEDSELTANTFDTITELAVIIRERRD